MGKVADIDRRRRSRDLARAIGDVKRAPGWKPTPEYNSWKAARARCFGSDPQKRRRYADRGITMCPEWDSFEQFLTDMGPRPSPAHTLDRVDNNGNYEPGNCRWATWRQQARNRQNTILVNGKPLIALSEVSVPGEVLARSRIQNWGWDPEIAISKGPIQACLFPYMGEMLSKKQIADRLGVAHTNFYYWINKCGMTVQEAINHVRSR